jgi:TonB family protein
LDHPNQRQGFLVSATVHVVVMTLLLNRPSGPPPKIEPKPSDEELRRAPRVMLPPPEVLRQLAPRSPLPSPSPQLPAPSARPEDRPKDRISIGPPSEERAKGPLILRREDDLTAVPKGRPNAVPSPAPSEAPRTAAEPRDQLEPRQDPSPPGLTLPPGAGTLPRGQDGARSRENEERPSIASSLRNLERRLQDVGPRGVPGGTGQQIGPLHFDPEGADFTAWINHFKNEVYRNWIPPQAALWGYRGGHVDFEFTVERNGKVSSILMLKSSGTDSLDRAAYNALFASRLLALPADYAPERLTINVSFYYGDERRRS